MEVLTDEILNKAFEIGFNYEKLWQVDYKALNGIIENEAMDAASKGKKPAPVNTKSQTFKEKFNIIV